MHHEHTADLGARVFDPRSLPPLSPLANELLALDIDRSDAEKTLLRVIESEPQRSMRLLGVANSAAYAHLRTSIESIPNAMRRIGLVRTRHLCIGMLFVGPMRSKLSAPVAEGLWVHALTVAFAAQQIARLKKSTQLETAYLVGLVHDLGYMAAEVFSPGALLRSAETSIAEKVSLEQAERQLLGVDHIDLTVSLLEFWKAPGEIIDAVHSHHDLDIAPDSLAAILFGAEKLSRFVDVADALYPAGGHPFPGTSIDRDGVEFLFSEQLQLSADEVSGLVNSVIEQVESLRQCARAMRGSS